MREVVQAKDRRNEILVQAIRLFSTKGYDKTSVNDIMEAVGIAKGTLYYHFKSKEDILNGILDKVFDEMIEKATAIIENQHLSIHEKMIQTLLSMQVKDDGSLQILEETHKPQNALMHQKVLTRLILELTPLLSKIIEEGNAQGVFHTEYPYESAELFLTYGNVVFDDGFMEFEKEEYIQKITAFIANMERVLGVNTGDMAYVLKLFQE